MHDKEQMLEETKEMLGENAEEKMDITATEYVVARMESWENGLNKGLLWGAIAGSVVTALVFVLFAK